MSAERPSFSTGAPSRMTVLPGCYKLATPLDTTHDAAPLLPARIRLTDTIVQIGNPGVWRLARPLNDSSQTSGETSALSWLAVDSSHGTGRVRIRISTAVAPHEVVFQLTELSRIPCPPARR